MIRPTKYLTVASSRFCGKENALSAGNKELVVTIHPTLVFKNISDDLSSLFNISPIILQLKNVRLTAKSASSLSLLSKATGKPSILLVEVKAMRSLWAIEDWVKP